MTLASTRKFLCRLGDTDKARLVRLGRQWPFHSSQVSGLNQNILHQDSAVHTQTWWRARLLLITGWVANSKDSLIIIIALSNSLCESMAPHVIRVCLWCVCLEWKKKIKAGKRLTCNLTMTPLLFFWCVFLTTFCGAWDVPAAKTRNAARSRRSGISVCLCLCLCLSQSLSLCLCLSVCLCSTPFVFSSPSLSLFFLYTALSLLSLIHIWRCRRHVVCRSRWSPYH